MGYPVTFEADYVHRRNRLSSFFRLLLALPILFWVAIYSLVAEIAVVIAWFAIVITGRYPKGIYDFVAGAVRLIATSTAYACLLCDPYPPFNPEPHDAYPVRMQFAGPLPQYSRVKTFFRFILAIPILILRYVIGLLLEITSVAAWFVAWIGGQMPRGLFDVIELAISYTARSDAYLFLLTETYPPFQDETVASAA
jgi:hypothetical protein